jgi:hypothetical protein
MTFALPPYSERLVGYLDILGWSEVVDDEKRASEVAMAMLEVQAERDIWQIGNALTRSESIVQMSEFSDCVAFSCDVDSPAAREQLLTRVSRLYLLWLERGFLRSMSDLERAVVADSRSGRDIRLAEQLRGEIRQRLDRGMRDKGLER